VNDLFQIVKHGNLSIRSQVRLIAFGWA
jgi:hypothetical protein